MYDGRDQRRTGVRVVRVEQIHPLWACKPAHEEGESDPRAWVEEQKSTSTDHASMCTARSSLLVLGRRSALRAAQTPCLGALWLSSQEIVLLERATKGKH
jgi:hypothetical protein